ncbi:MAG: hypothetical protein PVI55_18020 [Desulfobacterales bacterium]
MFSLQALLLYINFANDQEMNPVAKKPNYQFDFDIGTLIKSPCLNCPYRPLFPECMQSCRLLNDIQIALAESVSCTRRS